MIKRHSTPQNVNLKLPKCEPSLWNEIPGKTWVNDVKFQSTQALLIASVNCQLEVTDSIENQIRETSDHYMPRWYNFSCNF